jgi:hypothetical protein
MFDKGGVSMNEGLFELVFILIVCICVYFGTWMPAYVVGGIAVGVKCFSWIVDCFNSVIDIADELF